jgi:hypothetical protein
VLVVRPRHDPPRPIPDEEDERDWILHIDLEQFLKATPTGGPLDDGWRVRHDIVDEYGKLTLRHGSRLHHIGIGRRHRRRHVLILVKDLHIRISTTDGELPRDFELDPSRDYQPQPKT